jgi:hypothetical protein
MPIRRRVRPFFAVLPVLAIGLGACSDSTDPVEPLPVNEMALYAATVDRLALFGAAGAAHTNLRLAIDWPHTTVDAASFGNRLVFDSGTGWTSEDDPAIPANVLRVTWYDITQSIIDPQSERGYIDLTDQGGTGALNVRIAIHHDVAGHVADYALRSSTTETGGTRIRSLDVDGFFGDGMSQMDVVVNEVETRTTGADVSYDFSAAMDDPEFSWQGTVQEDSVSGGVEVLFDGQTRLNGETTRVELDIQDHPTLGFSGAGHVTHQGVRIADITFAGDQLRFTRPDGSDFTSAQQSRLGTLVNVILTPALVIQDQFAP